MAAAVHKSGKGGGALAEAAGSLAHALSAALPHQASSGALGLLQRAATGAAAKPAITLADALSEARPTLTPEQFVAVRAELLGHVSPADVAREGVPVRERARLGANRAGRLSSCESTRSVWKGRLRRERGCARRPRVRRRSSTF